MSPTRTYSGWQRRASDNSEQIEPYRKYYFICEGANTETWYFRKLIDLRKELNIHPLIEIHLLEKTEEDKNLSYPKKLIAFADSLKCSESQISFDSDIDRMIVVFDADIFECNVKDYSDVIKDGEKNNILAVTNPSFELFLLLHFENSYETDIKPNATDIIENKKVGNHRYICELLKSKTGINSKTNKNIGELASKVEIAIMQESKINQDIHQCKGCITSNIGSIISAIQNNKDISSIV
ncbi:MAG: RloB domain-containing protein [Oscillospiraceae bacterium]|nr:RloB domain-containing protein [Oscillospiraceae bacterium]